MIHHPDVIDPNDQDWATGTTRLRILAELGASDRNDRTAVMAAAEELQISRSRCYALLRLYRESPTVTVLVPKTRGRASGIRLLDAEVEAVVEQAIDEFYLTRRCPSIADLAREIQRRCLEKRLPCPSRKAITPRVRAWDLHEVLRRRKGAAYARSKLGRIVGHLTEDEPLGLVQIDHTLADVVVVTEADRRSLGRPWLTLAIDVATRMVVGFHLSLDKSSAVAVALVVSQAVLPKDRYLAGRGLDLDWPVSGLPRRLHLDNAKEFRSQALRRGVSQYGIEIDYRPPATPHYGGHIERLIGTMMGALRILPGATGRSVAERAVDPEGTAVLSLDELETWLVHQIAGVYHNTVHHSLGRPPITAWREAVAQLPVPHRQPADAERFYRDFLPFQRRIINRNGVQLFNVTYSDGILATMLAKPRQQYVVRYDPRDMSQVYLRDHDGSYWPIPYSDRRLPPVTLSELRAASRRLRASGKEAVSQRGIFASIDEQRRLVEQASSKKTGARREEERTRRALRGPGSAVVEVKRQNEPPATEDDPGPILPYTVEEWS
jgi:putative transposase